VHLLDYPIVDLISYFPGPRLLLFVFKLIVILFATGNLPSLDFYMHLELIDL